MKNRCNKVKNLKVGVNKDQIMACDINTSNYNKRHGLRPYRQFYDWRLKQPLYHLPLYLANPAFYPL